MRILVIGCGSIGRRHIRLLEEMGVDVVGYDISADACKVVAEKLSVRAYTDLDDVWDADADGVIIASPPRAHLESLEDALYQWNQRGYLTVKAVLVEKPVATNLHDAERLLAARSVDGLFSTPLLVGYNLRFHPGMQRLRQFLAENVIGKVRLATIHCGSYLPDWRPDFDYRLGYAAKKEQGGGVLLDISHELDYACWLFGEPESVMCMKQNSGSLEIETEDITDMLVRFGSGMQVNIHLDYLNPLARRECMIVGDHGTLTWTFDPARIDGTAGGRTFSWAATTEMEPEDGWRQYRLSEPDDMYRAELRNFLAVIEGKEEPVCTGEDGLRALRLALAAHESADTGRVVQF